MSLQRQGGLIFAEEGNFRDLDSGFLECTACGDLWCEHIEAFLKTGEDWVTLWMDTPPGYYTSLTVEAPVVPSAALWGECHLSYKENVRAYSVTYEDPDGFEQFIGFLHKGEGRLVLRSMVIDWFLGKGASIGPLVCPDRSHSFAAQKQWEKHMQDPKWEIAERFSVWARRKCLRCSTGQRDDFEDLIPTEDERSGNPFR